MRVHLNGKGEPIPIVALPDPNLDETLPPQTFIFSENGNFIKTDYVGLGYTHFEVVCIGASGGRGGASQALSGGVLRTYGGGGGGGGLHRVVGLLADIPDVCPVVVGQAGADGQDGNGFDLVLTHVNPDPPYAWTPDPGFIGPTDGADGGVSSFNGSTCRASGGKGGKKTRNYVRWVEFQFPGTNTRTYEISYFIPGGNGGQGGKGDQSTAGGGADGASNRWKFIVNEGMVTERIAYEGGEMVQTSTPPDLWHGPINEGVVFGGADMTPAEDGVWDGVIGEGGGGGIGGTHVPPEVPVPAKTILASSGGQGSFSFADTSVSGSRGNRSSDPTYGRAIVAGFGGGARASSLLKYGSRASGFDPNGLVFLRLTKIDT